MYALFSVQHRICLSCAGLLCRFVLIIDRSWTSLGSTAWGVASSVVLRESVQCGKDNVHRVPSDRT